MIKARIVHSPTSQSFSFVRLVFAVAVLSFALSADGQAQQGRRPAPTAYDALRTVGAARGEGIYQRLVTITGRGAAPQPVRWTLVFVEPASPTGLVQIDVERGAIVSAINLNDRKLRATASKKLMDLARLNLNSDGAFSIVEAEARNNRLGFDSVNFFLQAHEVTSQPVWLAELRNYRNERVGTTLISAETGKVLRPPVKGTQHTYGAVPPAGPAPGTAQTPRGPAAAPRSPLPGGDEGLMERVGRTMDKTAVKVEESIVELGNFLTGSRRRTRE